MMMAKLELEVDLRKLGSCSHLITGLCEMIDILIDKPADILEGETLSVGDVYWYQVIAIVVVIGP